MSQRRSSEQRGNGVVRVRIYANAGYTEVVAAACACGVRGQEKKTADEARASAERDGWRVEKKRRQLGPFGKTIMIVSTCPRCLGR